MSKKRQVLNVLCALALWFALGFSAARSYYTKPEVMAKWLKVRIDQQAYEQAMRNLEVEERRAELEAERQKLQLATELFGRIAAESTKTLIEQRYAPLHPTPAP